jgi:hypothetical protein
MTTSTTVTTIGTGRLTWPRGERVGDRYGLVGLLLDGDSLSEHADWVRLDLSAVGLHGSLQATVLETRQSTHIGDFFRGLYPSTPEVGEVITLGTGWLFCEALDSRPPDLHVGLQPDDGRVSDWLNPEALYRAHEQTVRLDFVPL